MDDTDFLHALPDFSPILGDDEDARQDVVLNLWKNRKRINRLAPYARRAAKNRRTDARRHTARERSLFWPLAPDHDREGAAALPLDALIAEETRLGLKSAIGGLPPAQRNAIASVYLYKLLVREACKRLGVSPTALNSALYYGRSNLRKALTETGRA